MRIDFNVLWVDDQPSSVDAQIRRITQSMATEGFNFKPTQCGSMQEVESRISTQESKARMQSRRYAREFNIETSYSIPPRRNPANSENWLIKQVSRGCFVRTEPDFQKKSLVYSN